MEPTLEQDTSNSSMDSVNQTNLSVVGVAPGQALGTLYQMVAQANGICIQNAVTNQNNLSQLNTPILVDAIAIVTGV